MRRSAVVFLSKTIVLAMAVLAVNAWAGPNDPSVSAQLSAVNTEVTYRRPAAKQEEALVTYAAYRLTVWNNTTNTLNRVYLNATALNVGGTDPVLFDSLADIASAYTCAGFNPSTSTLNCQTTLSIPPGGSTSFVVVARAPADGQSIRIDWSAGGHEGNGQGNGCCAVSGASAVTTLIDSTSGSFTTNAQSFIKNSGGKLFTGDRWITKSNDPITTLVLIPDFATAPYDLGKLSESLNSADPNCAALARFSDCYKTFVDIPNIDFSAGETVTPTQFLTIVVRLDSSLINRRTRIEDVLVTYEGSTVYLCAVTPGTYPCIEDRRVIRNQNSVENYTTDLKDDFQWIIKHFKNGGYAFF